MVSSRFLYDNRICLPQKNTCTYQYCFSHVRKYICVLFTVGTFYALLEEVFVAKTLNFSILLQSVKNVISGNLWDHMWFVYAIIGVYLVMPIIYTFMQEETKNICILVSLLFLFCILFPTFDEWVSVKALLPLDSKLFYVCFGAAFAKIKIPNKFLYTLIATGLLSVIWIIFGIETQKFGYFHLGVCLIATSIFLIATKVKIKPHKWILSISNCTWGVYLIHPLFINVAIKLFKIDLLASHPYVRLLAFAVVITCVSFGAVYLLRKIPLVKKLF